MTDVAVCASATTFAKPGCTPALGCIRVCDTLPCSDTIRVIVLSFEKASAAHFCFHLAVDVKTGGKILNNQEAAVLI